MSILVHASAKASHYNQEAASYDAFNEKNSAPINRLIEKILKKNKIRSVLDLTCGTGSQVIWLAKRGYQVVGVDINKKMLGIARAKVRKGKMDVRLREGDMRSARFGEFDAVLTIFNAVGHLTKRDFGRAMRNIHRNLRTGGLYIFDIFNLNHLLEGHTITSLTIDWQKQAGDTKLRTIQYSTIDNSGILASYTTSLKQKVSGKPKVETSQQTLQVYSAQELKKMLQENGFRLLRQCGIDGSRLSERKTERILTIAQKI